MMIRLSKGNQTTTAKVVQLEGELLTVTVFSHDEKHFSVGDVITCAYHEKEYNSRILRIWNNTIYLFFSIYKESFVEEGRRVPRVNVDLTAFAMAQSKYAKKVFNLNQIRVIDISLLGLGFHVEKKIETMSLYSILPQADLLPIKADITIYNETELESGFRYGAEFTHITQKHFQVLRTYVLTQQLTSGSIEAANDTSV